MFDHTILAIVVARGEILSFHAPCLSRSCLAGHSGDTFPHSSLHGDKQCRVVCLWQQWWSGVVCLWQQWWSGRCASSEKTNDSCLWPGRVLFALRWHLWLICHYAFVDLRALSSRAWQVGAGRGRTWRRYCGLCRRARLGVRLAVGC